MQHKSSSSMPKGFQNEAKMDQDIKKLIIYAHWLALQGSWFYCCKAMVFEDVGVQKSYESIEKTFNK